jgi:Fic family protein
MNPDRFQSSPAGKVIKVGRGDVATWTFVPHPLPPDLTPDWDLITLLSEADRALSGLAGVGRTLPNPHLLIGPFVRREAVLSSRIEGTITDITDLYAYEAGQLPLPGFDAAPPKADAQEVLNYVRALEFGLERVRTLPISLRLMRELHAKLLTGVRGQHATPGEFRRTQNWIGPPGCSLAQADFVPPPVEQMTESLAALERYLHGSAAVHPPLVRLALIHYQFEAIHPFVDGNGRVGRLLLSLLLVEWGLLSLPLLYLSAYFHQHRDEYYDLLMAVSERGAWKEWIRFFLFGVAEQAGDAVARATHLQDLRESWHRQLTETSRSTLLLRLADQLFTSPVLTISGAQELLGVSYPGAQRNVDRLVEAGILRQWGEASYGKTFYAPEILRTLGENSGKM